VHYVKAKGILSPGGGMNLYRGCSHGCIYCDSRSTCYNMQHDFEDIEIKENAIELLKKTLSSKRKKCMIGTGSMTDPYIPLENELQYVRRTLELIYEYGFGFTVITKSARILRDIDLLSKINQKTKCVVQMTLTTYDDTLCRIIEPNVSVTSERIEVLNILRDNGIPTVVWLSPILPFINDTEENLKNILSSCINAKVKGIVCFGFGVTLRDGNREYFYRQLDKHFPGLKERYIQHYGTAYECNSPNNSYLTHIFQQECIANGILYEPDKIFRYLHSFENKQEQLSLF